MKEIESNKQELLEKCEFNYSSNQEYMANINDSFPHCASVSNHLSPEIADNLNLYPKLSNSLENDDCKANNCESLSSNLSSSDIDNLKLWSYRSNLLDRDGSDDIESVLWSKMSNVLDRDEYEFVYPKIEG